MIKLRDILESIPNKIYKTIGKTDLIVMSKKSDMKFYNVGNKQEVGMKPTGLWYAFGTDWIDWVRHSMPEWEGDYIYKITLNYQYMLKSVDGSDIQKKIRD